MPLIAIQENRYVNTDHITQISYTPNIGTPRASTGSKSMIELPSQIGSDLTIQFLNKDVAPIHLEGDEADEAWSAFKLSQQHAGAAHQVSLNPETHHE